MRSGITRHSRPDVFSIIGSLDLGGSRTAPANSLSLTHWLEYQLILVFYIRVDEVAKQFALIPLYGLVEIVSRAVRHPSAYEAVGIVAAARMTLTGDRLASGVNAADMSANQVLIRWKKEYKR